MKQCISVECYINTRKQRSKRNPKIYILEGAIQIIRHKKNVTIWAFERAKLMKHTTERTSGCLRKILLKKPSRVTI